MGARRAAFRAELCRILYADENGAAENIPQPPPPLEATSNRLAELLARGCASESHADQQYDDAHTVYEFLPLVMLRLFGYQPGSGWLECISEQPHKDREALLRVILPDGPIHRFCQLHEPSASRMRGHSADFYYEFPTHNLPSVTQRDLHAGASGPPAMLERQSALAPLLRDSQRECGASLLYLTPLHYLELCMVSSAAHKWTLSPGAGGATRRARRSSSLPSVRALYNQLVAAYASRLHPQDRLDNSHSLLVAACVDMFCLPWADANSASTAPTASTQSVDALASVVISLTPKSVPQARTSLPRATFREWVELRNVDAIYMATEMMLDFVFRRYNSSNPNSTLSAFARLFALYVAPWKRSIKQSLALALFPRKRGGTLAAQRASLTSTLVSINEQIMYASGVSPQRSDSLSSTDLRKWREQLLPRRRELYLLLLCVIRSANSRLGGAADGCKALSLVAEAAHAAKSSVSDDDRGLSEVSDRLEEAKGCLHALRDQSAEAERRLSTKTRPFVATLGSCLGIQVENVGLFSGVAEKFVGVSSVASPASSGGSGNRFVRNRKSVVMKTSMRDDVEFIGSVWEQPITRAENEYLVMLSYKLSLSLEPYVGILVNTRFLGSYSTWIIISALLVATIFVRLMQALVS